MLCLTHFEFCGAIVIARACSDHNGRADTSLREPEQISHSLTVRSSSTLPQMGIGASIVIATRCSYYNSATDINLRQAEHISSTYYVYMLKLTQIDICGSIVIATRCSDNNRSACIS